MPCQKGSSALAVVLGDEQDENCPGSVERGQAVTLSPELGAGGSDERNNQLFGYSSAETCPAPPPPCKARKTSSPDLEGRQPLLCGGLLHNAEYAEGASLPDLDLLHDPEDELLCANLMDLVQATLGRAPLGAKRCSRLLMPAQLLAQVRTELLRLACSEPCGLRGALLDLCVEHGKACHDVGHIAVDPAVVPTFQLTLVLRLDSSLWPKIQGLFTSGPAFTPLKLSTGFRVIKKKLYSSEQLLIEEC
ncbi:PREDICTED: DNA damage-inducible transcript 4 protein [Aptenodytes forsteri]|nr:PREDICTED: DNA damage-inducible transcript 4 protein [Aptenodytes forsteri]